MLLFSERSLHNLEMTYCRRDERTSRNFVRYYENLHPPTKGTEGNAVVLQEFELGRTYSLCLRLLQLGADGIL